MKFTTLNIPMGIGTGESGHPLREGFAYVDFFL